jgi:hypothetical protein
MFFPLASVLQDRIELNRVSQNGGGQKLNHDRYVIVSSAGLRNNRNGLFLT